MKTIFSKALISILSLTIVSACSNHQQILPNGPAIADENFRLTRPLHKPSVTNVLTTSIQRNTITSIPLSTGDRLRIEVLGDQDFSGIYVIDVDGFLKLPYLKPIYANSSSLVKLKTTLEEALIAEKIFTRDFLRLSIVPLQWAATYINVQGAVYKTGNIVINERDFTKTNQQSQPTSGDFADKRLLSNALKAAGGLRPNANLSKVQLIRNGQHFHYDLSGLITGEALVNDPVLSNADTIIVPSVGFMQQELLQVSRVTPPGFRVFLSNLTVPAASNNSSAIGKFASNLPIGSRLLTAVMSANCVGGTIKVNANRHVVLAGIDLQTNKLKVMQKSIRELLNNPNADQVNPYLLPNDHIACFDSNMSNWRDLGRALGDIVVPLKILGGGL